MAKRPTKTVSDPTPSAFRLSGEEIERALLTGEHSGVLQDYFGDTGYAELRELTREASTRSVRGGPRVYVLPGIMGSTLGRKRKLLPDDVLWFDPLGIANPGKMFPSAAAPALQQRGLHPLEKAGLLSRE